MRVTCLSLVLIMQWCVISVVYGGNDYREYKDYDPYDIVFTAEYSLVGGADQVKILKVYKGAAGEYVGRYLKMQSEAGILRSGKYIFAMNYGTKPHTSVL